MSQSLLNFLLIGNDLGAARAIEKVGAAADLTNAKLTKGATDSERAWAKAGQTLNAIGKWSTVAAIGLGVAGVKAAVSFEAAMTRVNTQAGVLKSQIPGLSKAILQLSPQVGFNPDDLALSLYHVESAFSRVGISAQKAGDIVKAASELAQIGHADLETTTQAVIGVLASGIKGVNSPQDAAAQLNQLVGTGDTTLQKVAQSIATGILPTAATLGLTFKDVAAGIATLTDNVTPADMAARVLKTSLLTLIKPSKQQVTAFEELGMGALQLGQDFRKPNGLLTGVQDLAAHLNTVFPAGQKTALSVSQLDAAQKAYYQNLVNSGTNVKDATKQALAYRDSITGISAETLRANTVARALGGSKTAGTFLTYIQELPRLAAGYTQFGTSAQAATKFQQAWAQQQQTAAQKLKDLDASWHVFLIHAGNEILPTLKNILDVLSRHPGLLKDAAKAIEIFAGAWVLVKFANIITGLNGMARALLGVSAATREVGAANAVAGVEGAAAGAGAGAAEGAAAGGLLSRLGKTPLVRVAVPVVATVGAIKILGLQKSVSDLLHGDLAKTLQDDPKWILSAVGGISHGLNTLGIAQGGYRGQLTGTAVSYEELRRLQALQGAGQKIDLSNVIPQGFAEQARFIKGDQAIISDFNKTLAITKNLVDTNSTALTGNSAAAQTNRAAIGLLAQKAKDGADAQFRLTGKQSDYNAALRLGIGAIEAEAEKLGFNKQQVDALVKSLGLVPPVVPAKVTVDTGDAVLRLDVIKAALDRIDGQHFVDIQVLTTGTASAASIAQAATGVGHGLGGGRAALGGVKYGWTKVGENGPEIVHFGSTSRVFSNRESQAMVGGAGGNTFVIHAIDARSFDQWLTNGGAVRIQNALDRRKGFGGS